MTEAISLDDVFAVMASASYGDTAARVSAPDHADTDHVPTRLALALNVLLDDLSFRVLAAERSSDRLRTLVAAAHEFSAAAHDYEHLLEVVARRLATVVKDQCVVLLASEDERALLPVAISAFEAVAEPQMRALLDAPVVLSAHPLARQVHETGEPFRAARITPEEIDRHTPPTYAAYMRGIGVHSLLIMPLRTNGRSLGQLILSRYRSESPSFDKDDVTFVSAVADHAALAIANARSYAAERAARAAAEKAENEMRATEARYRLMFDRSPLPNWLIDVETLRYLAVNDAAIHEYGYSREEFLAMTAKDIRPPEDNAALVDVIQQGPVSANAGVWRHLRKNGDRISVEITTHLMTLDGRACRLTIGQNVTDRLRLEEQLRQSQKMDAVGRLAGGVAHDFNNVLSVILSYAELLHRETKPGEPMREDIEEIRKAGRRAADLTRQLLMFSRQQVIEAKVVDLNDLLVNMDKMLQRILGADVDLVSMPASKLGRIRVDPSSMEQIIMNLVVNARDAMPTGGKLTMETGNVQLDEAYARDHLGVKPGHYVMLAVTDTGVGMDKATQARIFEPFFTTKEQGKGTGLGLSTVFGIAQQSGGSVWVYSEPNRGTTFKVYLPRVDDVAPKAPTVEMTAPIARGGETILLVEDDDQVRTVARGILRRSGYHVIDARNAGEALLHSEKHPGVIHLLLSDVVMPQMSGPELAKRLASARTDMKVLCMSGYTDDSIVRHGVLSAQIAFLQKPITPESLTRKVRDVLDGRVTNGGNGHGE